VAADRTAVGFGVVRVVGVDMSVAFRSCAGPVGSRTVRLVAASSAAGGSRGLRLHPLNGRRVAFGFPRDEIPCAQGAAQPERARCGVATQPEGARGRRIAGRHRDSDVASDSHLLLVLGSCRCRGRVLEPVPSRGCPVAFGLG
jgi:hypothetical protein